jgi:hypothetical protein
MWFTFVTARLFIFLRFQPRLAATLWRAISVVNSPIRRAGLAPACRASFAGAGFAVSGGNPYLFRDTAEDENWHFRGNDLRPEGCSDSGFWPSTVQARALRRRSNAARTRDPFVSDWDLDTCAVPGTRQTMVPASHPPRPSSQCTLYVLPMCWLCAPMYSQVFMGAHSQHIASA